MVSERKVAAIAQQKAEHDAVLAVGRFGLGQPVAAVALDGPGRGRAADARQQPAAPDDVRRELSAAG